MKNLKFYILIIAIILISACGGLTEKQKKSAEDAVSALKKINAGVEIGINNSEYSKLLIEAQASVNQATENLPDKEFDEFRQALKLATEAYSDARIVWNKAGTDKILFACEIKFPEKSKNPAEESMMGFYTSKCDPKIYQLAQKYKIPRSEIYNDVKLPAMYLDEGLSTIWKKAKEHTDRASNILKSKT